jgi:hypothetical protein
MATVADVPASENSCGFSRYLDRNEVLRRIKIVFTSLVNDTNVLASFSKFIWQYRVDFANFERLGIATVVNA